MRGILGITLMAFLTAVAGCARSDAIEDMEVSRELDTSKTLKVLVTKDRAGASTATIRVYATAFANDDGGEESDFDTACHGWAGDVPPAWVRRRPG